jgi:uncharacterized protein YqhQ
MSERLPSYGGQAVLEGVMMRGSRALAVAVRDPKGQIQLKIQPLAAMYRGWVSKMPFVRGVLGLWDALGLGMQALAWASSVALGEEVAAAKAFSEPKKVGLGSSRAFDVAMLGTVLVSVSLGLGLFFLAPAAAGAGIDYLLHTLGLTSITAAGWLGNLAEGLIRLALIIGYVWVIGFIPDIKRLFGYHGAEHKVINAFEAGAPLTPESAAKFPLEHPRCGTAFLLVVVVFSIILFSLLGPLPLFWRFVSRILLVPVLAGAAYEYLRFTAQHITNPLVRLLVIPNLALQRLTTREPDLQMLEVSIAAFEAMRKEESTGEWKMTS